MVGQAVIVETSDPEIPWLVSAPTMRIPEPVPDTLNAFLAFRAGQLAVLDHNDRMPQRAITSVLCPGLATAIGAMPPDRCARQMHFAYDTVVGKRRRPSMSIGEILGTHREMLA